MARTSRKKAVSKPAAGSLPVPTAIYARLSHEDAAENGRVTIESQIEVIRNYLSGFRELQEAEVYIDNGFTGTNFERPAFQRMMQAVRDGQIRCIAVKDLSRLGRNYIETGHFIEKICPFFELRVISVNERFDSEGNGSGMLSAPIFHVINDLYSKDISKKTCSALRAKRQKGDFVGGYAPHGYRKDPENPSRLIADPQTAPVIRQIFTWRAEGLSCGAILRRLNQADIPSPGRYRFENGIRTNNNGKGSALLWNRHVLTDILKNQVYLGHLVQGRQLTSYYIGVPAHTVPPAEWAVCRNTHEPIVSEELFEQAQQAGRAGYEKCTGAHGSNAHLPQKRSVYGKKLVCAECGAVMRLHRSVSRNRDKAWFTYVCPTYAQHGRQGCSRRNIRQAELDAAVLESIRAQLAAFLRQETVCAELARRAGAQARLPQQGLPEVERLLAKKKKLFASLYADFKDGLLNVDEYRSAKALYHEEIAALEAEAERSRAPAEQLHALAHEGPRWIALAKQYGKAEALTAELVDALVSEIRVCPDGSLEIAFRFADMLEALSKNYRRAIEEGA